MPDLKDYMNAICKTKQHLMFDEDSESLEARRKYPAYIINKALSMHSEESCMIANELNRRGTSLHGLDNYMHFTFLLNILDRKPRWGKWHKPLKDEVVDLIVESTKYSRRRAEELVELVDEEALEALKARIDRGGAGTRTRMRRKKNAGHSTT